MSMATSAQSKRCWTSSVLPRRCVLSMVLAQQSVDAFASVAVPTKALADGWTAPPPGVAAEALTPDTRAPAPHPAPEPGCSAAFVRQRMNLLRWNLC
jgi:hypothetical protein